MEQKKLFSPKDLVFFALLLCVGAILFLVMTLAPKATVAIVEVNGTVFAQQDLSQLTSPKELTVQGEQGMVLTLVFSPDGAAIVSSPCPDQVCVHTGKITRAGESSLCLPAKVSLRLAGGEHSADAFTY